jgi:hypothetical protein
MSEASFLVDGVQDNNEMGQMLPAEGSLEDYDDDNGDNNATGINDV